MNIQGKENLRAGVTTTLGALALALSACGNHAESTNANSSGGGFYNDNSATSNTVQTSTSQGTGAGAGGATASTGATNPGSCATDPLHTGLTAMQTGVSVDAFDCQVLEWTAKYSEPDPMIFKAIMYVESRFDDTSVACPNLPCGTPAGWTVAESGCYGLMQVVPACGDDPDNVGLLGNGQPNLTTDDTSSAWAGSIFNPEINIEIGVSGVAGNRTQVENQFPGCTVDQYTMMAVGNYNSYGSTKSCTEYNTAYDNGVLMAYKQYAAAAGYAAHAY